MRARTDAPPQAALGARRARTRRQTLESLVAALWCPCRRRHCRPVCHDKMLIKETLKDHQQLFSIVHTLDNDARPREIEDGRPEQYPVRDRSPPREHAHMHRDGDGDGGWMTRRPAAPRAGGYRADRSECVETMLHARMTGDWR